MNFISKAIKPSFAEIEGEKIPMYFSMRAAAEMEERLETPYPEILDELFQTKKEGEPKPAPMPWRRQAEVIACLIRAGGMDASAED